MSPAPEGRSAAGTNVGGKAGATRLKLGVAALVLVALGVALLASGIPARALDAARLVRDLGQDFAPARSASAGGTARPLGRPVDWPGDDTSRGPVCHGVLYRGAGLRQGVIALLPGLDPEGGRDPRVIAVARTLTRFGFVVLVPDFASFERLTIGPADIAAVAATLRFLAARPEALGVGPGVPLGVAAISYAVGPAVLAALEPGLDRKIGFIVGFGGYYSTLSMVRFFTTGYFRLPGSPVWHHRVPNAYGKWVFVAANAGKIADLADRTTLMAMATRKLQNPAAPIGDLARALGPEGRRVYDLIENRAPGKVAGLVAALPKPIRRDLRRLSLARADLRGLKARLILIHNRGDRIIPYGESLALAAAAPKADLYLTSERQHIALAPRDLADAITLWRAAYRLLGERRAASALRPAASTLAGHARDSRLGDR